jgi:hypothetical protein
MAVPDMMKETADWMGNLNDMSNQTGVAVSKLVEMEEALRMSGASVADTSRMISLLADNLNSAATEGGPAVEALQKLGLSWGDWANLPVDRQFENIMRRVGELEPGFKGLETIMADLFGARMGYKLIRFARQFDGNMSDAKRNVGSLGDSMGKVVGEVDNYMDAWGRWNNMKRSFFSMMVENSMRVFGGSRGVNKIFDTLDVEKFRPLFDQAGAMFNKNIEYALQQIGQGKGGALFGDYFKNLGKIFGAGIKEAIMPKISLPKWLGKKSTNPGKDLSALIEKSNTLLADIRKEVGVAKFA